MAAPRVPFRGIQPFRYVDHAIFLARDDEIEELDDLVAIYRGVLLYGASGDGKSSLINAALLPTVGRRRLHPELVRVQPRRGEELVVERIALSEDDGELLPSLLVADDDQSSRFVMSKEAFEDRVREVCASGVRPLLIFDQFEELITLFEDQDARELQDRIAEMLVRLLRDPLAVKLLFVFREDHLSKVKRLMAGAPELVDQALHLEPLSADKLPAIVRGPFERLPGHFDREFDPEFAERVCAELAERFGSAEVNLSEVETVALRLWRSDDPRKLLETRRAQGLLEDDLGEALDGFDADLRAAAIALLAQMVTAAGTRNVISAEDLLQRVRDEDPDLSPALLSRSLERLERQSRLIRRERRRDIFFYEIASEFLVPWISRRREEARRERERARDRRRYVVLGAVAGACLVVAAVVAVIAFWALGQRAEERRQASNATALGLALTSTAVGHDRPDVAMLLGLAGYRERPLVQARSATMAAIAAARRPRVLAILHGHATAVDVVAFSPDGRTLASAGADGTVRLWSPRTHKQIGAPLSGRGGGVTSVAFSPDGRTLAAGDNSGTIRLWDPLTRRQRGTLRRGRTEGVFSLAYARDGRTLAAVGDETIRMWDPRSDRLLGALRSHAYGVAFSPDGRTLASGGTDDRVLLWDVRTRRQLGPAMRGHTDSVNGVAFSPDGRILASAGADRTIRLWDPATHRQLRPALRPGSAVNAVAFSPDGRTLASAGADGTIGSWDPRTHRQLTTPLKGHTGTVNGVAFSRDGRILASASDDDTIRLWNPDRTKRHDGSSVGHSGDVYDTALSPDGRTLALARGDGTIRLSDVVTGRQLGRPLKGHAGIVRGVAFSPDGHTLASAREDGRVGLWDVRTHKQRGAALRDHADAVSSVVFSPDGRALASADDGGTIRLWDPRSHARRARWVEPHGASVNAIAYSHDGRTLASADGHGAITLWDPRTQVRLGTLHAVDTNMYGVAFSPDGATIASGGNEGAIRLWDPHTHKLVATIHGNAHSVYDVAYSPDGRTVASGGEDGTSRLWDPRAHKQLGPALRGRGSVAGVAFGSGGRTLVSAGDDGSIHVWEHLLWRNAHELQTDVCTLVGGGLSAAEWQQFAGGIEYRPICP